MANNFKKLSEYIFDPQKNFFVHPNNCSIEYQDSSELFIYESLKNITDLSTQSIEFNHYIKDLPTQYHLSHMRLNFLDSLEDIFSRESEVLEIGCGCGTITRWLGEHFKNVDALEGNSLRAKITRARTKDLNNVAVYCGDLLATNFDKKYDLIILIGSLEYIPFYSINNANPYEICSDFLLRLSRSLKDNGILLVAIENKIGIKYFSGCREDHTGKFFSGIMGYPDKTPVTFGRTELESMLSHSGLKNIQFYHVYPDYKMTETIIVERKKSLLLYPYNWIRTPFIDYFGIPLYLFPETLFLKTIADAGLFWHFSNSFVILASRSGKVNLEVDWHIKKYHNYQEIAPIFHHTITLSDANTSSLTQYTVNRVPIGRGALFQDKKNFIFELHKSDFVPGRVLASYIIESIFSQSPEQAFIKIIQNLHNEIIHNFSTNEYDNGNYLLLLGNSLDYTIFNVIVDNNNRLIAIDNKWRTKMPIPIDYILFRNTLIIFEYIKPYINNKDRLLFSSIIMKQIFKDYSFERMREMFQREEEFQSFATGRTIKIASTSQLNPYIFQEIDIAYLFAYNIQTFCYINTGNGFSEEELIHHYFFPQELKTPIHIYFDLKNYPVVKGIRWDPLEGQSCTIKIDEILIEMRNKETRKINFTELKTNADTISNNEFRFSIKDPWILIPVRGLVDNISILCSYFLIYDNEQNDSLNRVYHDPNSKNTSIYQMYKKLEREFIKLKNYFNRKI